jgi:hypothetical protein
MYKNRITRGSSSGVSRKSVCQKSKRTKRIHYKISRLSDYSLRLTPLLVLSGVWFQRAGFDIGEMVEIEIFEGKIIISNLLPF